MIVDSKRSDFYSSRRPKLDITQRSNMIHSRPVHRVSTKKDSSEQSTTEQLKDGSVQTIDVNINLSILPKGLSKILLPLKKKVDEKTKHFSTLQKRVAVLSCVAIIFAVTLGGMTLRQQHTRQEEAANNNRSTPVENVEYQTVLPEGKSISDLGGWERISPPGSDPVFAYTDTIDDVPVSVSQQPLPASLQGSTDDQIDELAKKFNANNKITSGNTVVYVGTSAKGPQSAILTKNSLLILIKSQKKIDDSAWAAYAASLN